jgi:hypothetical protein
MSDAEITISVSSESGLTSVMADAMANATEIGGGMVNLSEGTVDEGTDANGNGNDNDMADAVMPAGNGVYTGVVTVGAVDDGEYMISITGTDDSENESDPVTVSVTVDNVRYRRRRGSGVG